MEVDKLIAEVERECSALMHQILNELIGNQQYEDMSNS
jgi:hypothetical protein